LRVFYGQYQDFAKTLSGVPAENLVFGARVTDGGRFLSYSKSVNECFNESVLFKPRLKLAAPWLQGRLTNVCAPFDIPPAVSTPGDDYWWAGDSASEAGVVSPYFYGPC